MATVKLIAPNGATVNVPEELAENLIGYKPAKKTRKAPAKKVEPKVPEVPADDEVPEDPADDEGDEDPADEN